MNDRYARHLAELRARHAEDLDILGHALAMRAIHSGALRSLKKRYAAIERETKKILAVIDRREGSHEGNEERA